MKTTNHTLFPGYQIEYQDVQYTIEETLGSGGFGITYKALYEKEVEIQEQFQVIRTKINVPVAIKELFIEGKCVRNEDSSISLQSLERQVFDDLRNKFLDEAKTLSRFNKEPGIVHVISWFETNNTAYMVMEYIEGQTLDLKVKNAGSLSEEEGINYIKQVATSLENIHRSNMIHRDVKPANIIVTPKGQAVLIDFGAARGFVADKSITHSVILTHGYAPIEQYSEKRKRGPFTDIYALGATLYYCLTGDRPISAFDIKEHPLDLDKISLSQTTKEVLRKSLEFEPENRYRSCSEFVQSFTNDSAPDEPPGGDEDDPGNGDSANENTDETVIVNEPKPINNTLRIVIIIFSVMASVGTGIQIFLLRDLDQNSIALWLSLIASVLVVFPYYGNKEVSLFNYLLLGFLLPTTIGYAIEAKSEDNHVIFSLLLFQSLGWILLFIFWLHDTKWNDIRSVLALTFSLFLISFFMPVTDGYSTEYNGFKVYLLALESLKNGDGSLLSFSIFLSALINTLIFGSYIYLMKYEMINSKILIIITSVIILLTSQYLFFENWKSLKVGYWMWCTTSICFFVLVLYGSFKNKYPHEKRTVF